MSYHHLTMDERNVIYRMQWQGYSQAETARCLGRHRSTISREFKRNAARHERYDPGTAQTRANVRRRNHLQRPKTGSRPLMAYVAERLRDRWSPEQIAGRLAHQAPAALEGLTISHTTMQSGDIYEQAVVKTVAGFFTGLPICISMHHAPKSILDLPSTS